MLGLVRLLVGLVSLVSLGGLVGVVSGVGGSAALGGGELAVYRAVSIPCLLAVAWLAVVLVGRTRSPR